MSVAILTLVVLVVADAGAAPDEGGRSIVPCTHPFGCPDLTVDMNLGTFCQEAKTFEADDCAVVEGLVETPGERKLFRFTTTTPNLGPGDLTVGIPDLHPEWYEHSPCHNHFHMQDYAEYRIWSIEGYIEWNEFRKANPGFTASHALEYRPDLIPERIVGRKQAFYLVDIRQYSLIQPPKYLSCRFQGISVGWADVYDCTLDGQWVDITDLPEGPYVFELEINPERRIEETNYANNRRAVQISISDGIRTCEPPPGLLGEPSL